MTRRVLIADDSMLMRKMIAECLADAGWEIAGEAQDGQQAVGMYRTLRRTSATAAGMPYRGLLPCRTANTVKPASSIGLKTDSAASGGLHDEYQPPLTMNNNPAPLALLCGAKTSNVRASPSL